MKSLAWVLLLGLPAAADELILRNGSVFSGVVREEGDKVTIQMDYGTMSFKRVDVREIRRSDDPIKELDAKVLKASTAKDYYELGLWARDRGLPGRSDELMKRTLALEPDHEGARRALGYERVEGRWLSAEERLRAEGYVKHNGRWITLEAQERLKEREHEERIEAERQKTAREAAEMNREIELQKIQLERERLQMELEKARRERFHVHSGYGPYPCCAHGPAFTPWPSFTLTPGPGGAPAHPGPGPGRTLPPAVDNPHPGGVPSSTPPAPPRWRSSGTRSLPAPSEKGK